MNRRDAPHQNSWTSWSLSILLHLALVGVAVGVWYWNQRARPLQPLAIEGTVVTSAELANMPQSAEPAQPLEEVAPELEPAPIEPEPLPLEEVPPEEDPAQREAEAQRLAQEQRLAEEQLAATQAREQAEREKTEREQRERAEREKVAKEKADKDKAERARLAREKAERERLEQEATERTQRESELDRQLEAERQRAAARNSVQARQYADLIRARVERAWVRPATARVGLVCEVRVTQVVGGTVTGVRIGSCNGDEIVRQSIEAAVLRASPLPQPPDPTLFERELIFNFAPSDDR